MGLNADGQAQPRPSGPHLRHHGTHGIHQPALGGHARGVRRHPRGRQRPGARGTPLGRPDQGPAAPYVDEFERHPLLGGGRHVGRRQRQCSPLLDARLNYVGNDETDLDAGLFGDTEEGAFLRVAAARGAPWIQYPDYDWQAGSLANGSGVFKISKLRKGQYAFAKGDVSVALPEVSAPSKPELCLMPNPASKWCVGTFLDSCPTRVTCRGRLQRFWPVCALDGPMPTGAWTSALWPRALQVRFGTEGGAIAVAQRVRRPRSGPSGCGMQQRRPAHKPFHFADVGALVEVRARTRIPSIGEKPSTRLVHHGQAVKRPAHEVVFHLPQPANLEGEMAVKLHLLVRGEEPPFGGHVSCLGGALNVLSGHRIPAVEHVLQGSVDLC